LLLLVTIPFMVSALVTAFANHYWVLGILISLVSLGLLVVVVLMVFASGEGQPEWSDERFHRVATYLLVPLIVSAVGSVIAWGMVLVVIPGGIY
jgi:hypothetical protein